MSIKERVLADPKWQAFPKLHQMAASCLNDDKCWELLMVISASPGSVALMCLQDAYDLDHAFTWLRSPQGHTFWEEVHTQLMNGRLDYGAAYFDPDTFPGYGGVPASPMAAVVDGDDFMPKKKVPKEWEPDKANGDHVMNITREMF